MMKKIPLNFSSAAKVFDQTFYAHFLLKFWGNENNRYDKGAKLYRSSPRCNSA